MPAKLPPIDWGALVGALGLVGALIGWFLNRRANNKTSARQDKAEQREQERERRAVAEHVWITMSRPYQLLSTHLTLTVWIYNHSSRPIYNCKVERLFKMNDSVQFADETNPLRKTRPVKGRGLRDSDLMVSIVPPSRNTEGRSSGHIEFEVEGSFDLKRAGLNPKLQDEIPHTGVEVSFSDGLNRWIIDSRGAPPKLLSAGD
jgi:hypothetical protein